jgi:hypothetical protein
MMSTLGYPPTNIYSFKFKGIDLLGLDGPSPIVAQGTHFVLDVDLVKKTV